jgi:spore germination protein YaaH
LTSIAAFFGVSNAAIVEANQLANQDQLTEGQILTIPPAPPSQLTVTPDEGRAGQTFTLTLTGAEAGESVTFTIHGPRGRPFTGPAHSASPEGAVTAEYDSSGDALGTHTVVATGDRGTSETARYRLRR